MGRRDGGGVLFGASCQWPIHAMQAVLYLYVVQSEPYLHFRIVVHYVAARRCQFIVSRFLLA